MMAAHWTGQYTVPNAATYPFQWLWDSCFHAVVWAALGDGDRATGELASVFRHQTGSGFVPHVTYDADPDHHAPFWGRSMTSSITQPPMYGHAVAELGRRGVDVAPEIAERAGRGLAFLLRRRARVGGLVALCHPWESGADDSPRWDSWRGDATWFDRKGELVATVEHGPDGEAISNPAFEVASAGFNALVAFNARELAAATGDARLAAEAGELAGALDDRWDAELGTWTDAVPDDRPSSAVRTLDGLLPALVCDRPTALDPVLDPAAHGAPFGPTYVHRAEPSFDPGAYWRGSAWPQLIYLCWLAASGRSEATDLADLLRRGARRSGLAEHWNPETGAGLGAAPQSWTGLAVVVER